jgi:hypothetical protein
MKQKIFIFLFPLFLFGQNKIENFDEMKFVENRIKLTDSISNFITEEIQNMEVIPAHARIDGKPTEATKIIIRTLKYSNQILRIYYTQSNLKEKWTYYYFDSKLIYAESSIIRGKKKISKKKFYFKDDKLIYPSYSDQNYDAEEEVKVFLKANELLKSNN